MHWFVSSYEIWNDKKPNISYFRAFGCVCYVHNNGKDNLGKFDSKADETIFLGYSTTSKAYRAFNKRTLVVEESVHVVFDETNSVISKHNDDEVSENNLEKHSIYKET